MPDQPPTPISHYAPDAPPSPMVPQQQQEPRIQHHPIQQPLSTNQVMNNMHQKTVTHTPNQPTQGRMNLRERKEPPQQSYHSGMDQSEPINSNRRRRVRRQLIIDQVPRANGPSDGFLNYPGQTLVLERPKTGQFESL